jgi:hypothetical protein
MGHWDAVRRPMLTDDQVWECLFDVKMWLYFFLGLTANIVSDQQLNRIKTLRETKADCPAQRRYQQVRQSPCHRHGWCVT